MLHRGTNLVISFILSLILAIVARKSLSLPCTFLTGLTVSPSPSPSPSDQSLSPQRLNPRPPRWSASPSPSPQGRVWVLDSDSPIESESGLAPTLLFVATAGIFERQDLVWQPGSREPWVPLLEDGHQIYIHVTPTFSPSLPLLSCS